MDTLTPSEYFAHPGMNASVLVSGRTSMRHMRYAATKRGHEQTAATRWGTIVHTAVLEPEAMQSRYAVWSGGRKAGGAYEQFTESVGDREVITVAERNDAEFIRTCIRENSKAASLLDGIKHIEAGLSWTVDGRDCKGRLDGIGDGYFIDLKTANDITDRGFESAAYRLGYHIKMGWYHFGLNKVTGAKNSAFIIAVESDPPYDCRVFECSREFLERGMIEAAQIHERYFECCKANHFPGVSATVDALHLPSWAIPDVELI